jgi:uncharacterized membrane protein (UPF0127 family)
MPNSGRAKTKLVRKFLSSSNYIWIIGLAALVVIILAVTTFSHDQPKPVSSPCGVYRTDKVVRISSETINAEVASTDASRTQGLSGRPCILPNQGMLFVFDKPGFYSFWMKDMKFPIDIIWISPEHKVVGLERDVEPSTYYTKNPFFINDKTHIAQYVLELKANRSTDMHMTLGTPVTF